MIIAICGFMGAGKSSILKSYPEVNGVDLDQVIESSHGALGEFIRKEGFHRFREIEFSTLKSLVTESLHELIALGGGALDREENRKWLKENQVKILYLEVSFEEAMTRIKGDSNRPQLDKSEQELRELYEKRVDIYKSIADLTLPGNQPDWPTNWTLMKALF